MYCICIVYVLYMYCICIVYVLYMYCICIVYVLYMHIVPKYSKDLDQYIEQILYHCLMNDKKR